ncbi:MAG: DUF2852 domain-containing protein [Rhodospirillales bacterium]|nr:MAG: DUF2852 domain-containing protein [Rhodospirillales bacterium]
MTSIAARLNELPTLLWIALAMLGFVVWWPLGLAVLAYILWSGRMGCCGFGFGRWNDRAPREGQAQDWFSRPRTSGNRAFDAYRAETLRRLEDEHRAFQEYLDRLRMAKDRAEFDQFMAERGGRADSPPKTKSPSKE